MTCFASHEVLSTCIGCCSYTSAHGGIVAVLDSCNNVWCVVHQENAFLYAGMAVRFAALVRPQIPNLYTADPVILKFALSGTCKVALLHVFCVTSLFDG